MKIRTKLKIL